MSADGQGCACRFIFKDGWLKLIPESECGYHRALRASADVQGEAIWARFIDHLNAVEPIVFKKADGQVPHANLHGSIEHYKRIFLESQSNSPSQPKP